jgi:hypothetical protein
MIVVDATTEIAAAEIAAAEIATTEEDATIAVEEETVEFVPDLVVFFFF